MTGDTEGDLVLNLLDAKSSEISDILKYSIIEDLFSILDIVKLSINEDLFSYFNMRYIIHNILD